MADTVLVTRANRFGPLSFLEGGIGSVPLDATTNETFFLPVGYGQLLIESVGVSLTSLSGTYAAPTPAYDGFSVDVIDQTLQTVIDNVGASRFVYSLTQSARPAFRAVFDLNNRTFMAQFDRIRVQLPIIAGAGITGQVGIYIRGQRIFSS